MIRELIVVTEHFLACLFIKRPTPPTEVPISLSVGEDVGKPCRLPLALIRAVINDFVVKIIKMVELYIKMFGRVCKIFFTMLSSL